MNTVLSELISSNESDPLRIDEKNCIGNDGDLMEPLDPAVQAEPLLLMTTQLIQQNENLRKRVISLQNANQVRRQAFLEALSQAEQTVHRLAIRVTEREAQLEKALELKLHQWNQDRQQAISLIRSLLDDLDIQSTGPKESKESAQVAHRIRTTQQEGLSISLSHHLQIVADALQSASAEVEAGELELAVERNRVERAQQQCLRILHVLENQRQHTASIEAESGTKTLHHTIESSNALKHDLDAAVDRLNALRMSGDNVKTTNAHQSIAHEVDDVTDHQKQIDEKAHSSHGHVSGKEERPKEEMLLPVATTPFNHVYRGPPSTRSEQVVAARQEAIVERAVTHLKQRFSDLGVILPLNRVIGEGNEPLLYRLGRQTLKLGIEQGRLVVRNGAHGYVELLEYLDRVQLHR